MGIGITRISTILIGITRIGTIVVGTTWIDPMGIGTTRIGTMGIGIARIGVTRINRLVTESHYNWKHRRSHSLIVAANYSEENFVFYPVRANRRTI